MHLKTFPAFEQSSFVQKNTYVSSKNKSHKDVALFLYAYSVFININKLKFI